MGQRTRANGIPVEYDLHSHACLLPDSSRTSLLLRCFRPSTFSAGQSVKRHNAPYNFISLETNHLFINAPVKGKQLRQSLTNEIHISH